MPLRKGGSGEHLDAKDMVDKVIQVLGVPEIRIDPVGGAKEDTVVATM